MHTEKKKLVFLLLLLSFMSLGFSQTITMEDRAFVGNALVEKSYDYLVQTVAMTRNSSETSGSSASARIVSAAVSGRQSRATSSTVAKLLIS